MKTKLGKIMGCLGSRPAPHHGAGVAEILRRQPQTFGVQLVEPRLLLPPLEPLAAVGAGVGAGTEHLLGEKTRKSGSRRGPQAFFFALGGVVAHLQQGVAGVFLEEGARGFVSPRVRRPHLHLQLPQLLQTHREVPTHGHQTFQIVQAGVVVSVLGGEM